MKRLDFTVISARNGIPVGVREAWRELQANNPNLGSPFFSPEFTEIVAQFRTNVEIAVWKDGSEVVALFPYERNRGNFASPVGGHIADYDGLIARPDFIRDAQLILVECGLVAWDFQHSLATNASFEPFYKSTSNVAITDISCGYDAYIHKHSIADRKQLKNYLRRMRKLEEEVGPLNFVMHTPDENLLQSLIALKSAQCLRNTWPDIFRQSWVADVLLSIQRTQTPEFAGVLSTLHAGPHLVALHFGMRSSKVLHRWFPVHDESFSIYSPGIVLRLKMLEQCPKHGIDTVDWGAGENSLKQFVMDYSITTGSGSVELLCAATMARRVVQLPSEARRFIGKSRIGGLARSLRNRLQAKNNPL